MDYRYNIDKLQFPLGPGATFNCIYDIGFDDPVPVIEPVTLQEALDHCLIDALGQDNTIVEAFITTARQMCEQYTNIGFINRDLTVTLCNACGGIYLPYGPVVDITSMKNYDGETIPTFKVIGPRFKQIAEPMYSYIEVEYNAGYVDLPQVLKRGLLCQVAYLYEHRGDEKEGTMSPVAMSLLKPLRRVS